MTTTEQILALIAEHRKVVDAATKGEWDAQGFFLYVKRDNGREFLARFDCKTWEENTTNPAFVAHARNTIPALLDALEVLVNRVEYSSRRFEEYAQIHRAKGNAGMTKAIINQSQANAGRDDIKRALALLKGQKP